MGPQQEWVPAYHPINPPNVRNVVLWLDLVGMRAFNF